MNADLNNANKTNRRRTVKTRSRFTTLLTVYFFVALIIPNCVLANTEPYSVWTVEALILMPLGPSSAQLVKNSTKRPSDTAEVEAWAP